MIRVKGWTATVLLYEHTCLLALSRGRVAIKMKIATTTTTRICEERLSQAKAGATTT